MGSKIHRNSLKPGHKINSYEVIEILGQGGFGITYLANDKYLNRKVAIKEYLPIELAVREVDHSVHPVSDDHGKQFKWGLDRFLSEAETLAQFEHPNIVRVYAVFEENNTGYMVMAYEHGQSLQKKLDGKKTLEEAELLKILIPILGGLELVHKAGFIHRDIKPDNIFIRQDGSPVLLDFGSARQALGEQTKTLTSLVSPGYAPFEQYYSKSDQQGPWTDIYSLGATLYRAIAGIPPMDAVDRSNAILKAKGDIYVSATEIGKGIYSERFLKAIDHSLQFKEENRPQTISSWKAEFDLPEDPIKNVIAIELNTTRPGTQVLKKRQKKNLPLAKVALLGVIIIVGILYLYRDKIQDYYGPMNEQLDVEHQRIEEANNLASLKQKEEEALKRRDEEQQRIVGPESSSSPVELGEVVRAFMPDRNYGDFIGWDIGLNTNVPIEWLTDGLEDQQNWSVRRGRVRVTVDGKKMYILRKVPEELYWNITVGGWRKGVSYVDINPYFDCFGSPNSGCDYDFERVMNVGNISTQEICAFHIIDTDLVGYALSSDGKRDVFAYVTISCGSGGCSTDLRIYYTGPGGGKMSKEQCEKLIKDDYLSWHKSNKLLDLIPGRGE